MILQSAPEGQDGGAQFVVKQTDHGALCGQFASAMGNDRFKPPLPRDEVVYAITCHDNGWLEIDEAPLLDPETRLPFNVLATPPSTLFVTSQRSPNFNERHHPYCGLISSMHSWGLYNGRYGLSDKILVDFIEAEYQAEMQTMLEGELIRQERIKAELAADPETASWIQEDRLFSNYKLLQFCDTMALYFNLTPEGARGETSFPNVPVDVDEDVSVAIRPLGNGTYSLTPYPFQMDGFEAYLEGRYLKPFPPDAKPDLADIMRNNPVERQTFRFVAG